MEGLAASPQILCMCLWQPVIGLMLWRKLTSKYLPCCPSEGFLGQSKEASRTYSCCPVLATATIQSNESQSLAFMVQQGDEPGGEDLNEERRELSWDCLLDIEGS